MYPPKIIIFRLKYEIAVDLSIHKNNENVNKTALVKVDLSWYTLVEIDLEV